MTHEERLDDMLARYGEAVRQVDAARMLTVSRRTVAQMLADGRLRRCCGGTRVDVRSIAEYIAAPAAAEEEGRLERIRQRRGTAWAV